MKMCRHYFLYSQCGCWFEFHKLDGLTGGIMYIGWFDLEVKVVGTILVLHATTGRHFPIKGFIIRHYTLEDFYPLQKTHR